MVLITTKEKKLQNILNALQNTQQKTQIVDSNGNIIGSTSNALNMNMTVGGANLQLDDTTKLAVSLYANSAAAGDTSLNVGGGAEAGALLVTLANDSTGLIATQPFSAVLEGGLTELIGINEQVDQNDYSGSVGVALGGTYSGEILNVMLVQTEDNTGAIIGESGVLFIYDTDPSISSGDTAMTAADGVTVIGKIDIASTDWVTDANTGIVHLTVAIGFHAVSTLYFAYKHTGTTTINSGANDDEQLEFQFWFRRDS